MAEHYDDAVAAGLRRLRAQVRGRVPAPAAAGVRARADRRLRVRRTGVALVTAAVVAALAFGGTQLLRPAAGPPVPPAGPPSPTVAPSGTPSPTGQPPDPQGSVSPRPSPRPAQPPDDPIAEVDWSTATITVPPRDGCPTGRVTLAPESGSHPLGSGPAGSYPKISVSAAQVAYGDLTGDGRLEAVVEASCADSPEGQGSGHGFRLLALARQDDGTLTGLDWAGPPGAYFASYWVADGRLLVDADPATAGPEDFFPVVPGLVLSYRWDGNQLAGWEPAPEYPPIAPPDEAGDPVPVRPRAVAAGLGCPADELRFTRDPEAGGWTAPAAGAVFSVPALPSQPYLFDLDRTGDRLLVTALACEGDPGTTAAGLAVFERAGDGWQGISVLRHPDGLEPALWQPAGRSDGEGPDGDLEVEWSSDDGSAFTTYRWTGTLLEPVDG